MPQRGQQRARPPAYLRGPPGRRAATRARLRRGPGAALVVAGDVERVEAVLKRSGTEAVRSEQPGQPATGEHLVNRRPSRKDPRRRRERRDVEEFSAVLGVEG